MSIKINFLFEISDMNSEFLNKHGKPIFQRICEEDTKLKEREKRYF